MTSKVELGISVLQLPLRNPVELAHRVQSLQAMSNNRLILGPRGSMRDDFELLGYDYDHRLHVPRRSRDHGQGVERRAGQWRHLVDLAGVQGRPADLDRRLAQPALDHLLPKRAG